MSQPGRKRSLTPRKQQKLCRLVAHGATVAEAADEVGVSLRTVQREVSREEDFEHDLALAQEAAPVDPLRLMHQAARTHWRAAAWLLERSDPERYARRRPDACTAQQFQSVMAAVIEAALEAVPPEFRPAVYERTEALAEKALRQLFPRHAPAPFTAPAGLKRNILSREQELNAYLDEVAQNYQNPPPAAASAPAAVTPGPAPKSAPNNTDSAPRQTLPPPAASRQPPAASPSPQAYYLSRLADRLRYHLAQANNGRAQRGPNNAPSNQLPAAAPQPPAPSAVLSPKTELPLQTVNGRQTAWLGSPDNWERSSE